MKKILIFIVISLLLNLSLPLYAQHITFSRVFYDSLQNGIQAHSIVRSFDKGYVIAGVASSQKGIILKIDSIGNLSWNKTFGNNTNIYPDVILNSIIATNDSCFIIAGSAYNAVSTHTDAFCAKIKSNGDTLWSKRIIQSGFYTSILSIEQTNDSGYVMTGSASEVNTTTPYSKIFAAKLDLAGNLQWTNILTGSNNNSFGSSIKQTPDKAYIITGYMENDPPYDPNAFLVKLTSLGTLSWSKTYHLSTSAQCSGNDLVILSNGFLCYLNTGNNTTLMKTDFSGNILWSKSYSQSFGNSCFSCSSPKLHKTTDGAYVFVSGSDVGSEITKTDSAGYLLWSKGLSLAAVDIVESNDKGFFIAGNGPMIGFKMQQGSSSLNIGTIKTDSLGNEPICVGSGNVTLVHDTIFTSSATIASLTGGIENVIHPNINSEHIVAYSGCVERGSGINETKPAYSILVSPNPSAGIFTFSIHGVKQAQITIYSTLGEKTYQAAVYNEQFEIDLSTKPKGIYFYEIMFSDKNISTGKLILK